MFFSRFHRYVSIQGLDDNRAFPFALYGSRLAGERAVVFSYYVAVCHLSVVINYFKDSENIAITLFFLKIEA